MANVSAKTKVIVENGRPTAVVLSIRQYEKLLELAEEKEDLADLRRVKRDKTSFRPLSDYLKKRV